MATQWLRRACLLAAGASMLVLASCGGGTVVSQLAPTRIVAFGDGMADLGQNASGQRFTVNDGSVNNWTQHVAVRFGVALGPAKGGGTSYAMGNARVTGTPGAGGDAAALPVAQQIDAFRAVSSFGPNDLVLVSAGTSDVIVQAQAAITGTQTREQMLLAVGQAGTQLGAQVRRLVDAGAAHVVVAGSYNLARSAWAKQTGQQSLLEAASLEFNTKFLVSVVDLGARVLYLDAAQQFNLYESNPASFNLTDATNPVCNSVDAGEGIGTGVGQVDSSECTTATLTSTSYDSFLFADRVYPTPRGHRLFGEHAAGRIRERW
ncbi:MAG TPA: SGNH/GDSL hydrolase family protein [Ramlibacter sp.]|uniref:SGNH/GDSL hydrolase family protein n=1 Tax=Ramlibacter sp. TaxID=1917967 RepID=UPI002ED09289